MSVHFNMIFILLKTLYCRITPNSWIMYRFRPLYIIAYELFCLELSSFIFTRILLIGKSHWKLRVILHVSLKCFLKNNLYHQIYFMFFAISAWNWKILVKVLTFCKILNKVFFKIKIKVSQYKEARIVVVVVRALHRRNTN